VSISCFDDQSNVSWVGFLGTSGSYFAVYIFLFISTSHHLGKDFISPSDSSSGFAAQMTIWHNLLAIWLWRYLISAVESLSIPGIISVRGWITYHLPSYYLWITTVFFLMLVTKKTASSGVSGGCREVSQRLMNRKLVRGTPVGCLGRLGQAPRRARAEVLEVGSPALALGRAEVAVLAVAASLRGRPSRIMVTST
jgi:hypothetical protein